MGSLVQRKLPRQIQTVHWALFIGKKVRPERDIGQRYLRKMPIELPSRRFAARVGKSLVGNLPWETRSQRRLDRRYIPGMIRVWVGQILPRSIMKLVLPILCPDENVEAFVKLPDGGETGGLRTLSVVAV